jgi:hypothetical protein
MTASRDNPVVAENLKLGTLSWLPERVRFTPETLSWASERPRSTLATSTDEISGPDGETRLPVGHYNASDIYRDSGRSARIEGWC